MYNQQVSQMKQNMITGQPQINNRYQESDQIFIDPTLSDLHKNLFIQREQNLSYNPNIQSQRTAMQSSSIQQNNLNQKQNIISQRNYIIYQPQTAFQKLEIPSDAGSNLSSQPNEENFKQISQNNEMDSFINDTDTKDVKKIRLQQFVKASDNWKENSQAQANILNEKRDELRVFYLKQEEKVQHFFYTLEKFINQEKNNMIFSLQEGLRMNLNQVDGMMKQLQIFQEECDKLKEDVALNFSDIIEEMRNEPFNEILKMYNQKLTEFELYTKKSCQQVHVELVTLDFINSSKATNLTSKWETSLKTNFMNKAIQFNSQYVNLMKDNLSKPLQKNTSRERVQINQIQSNNSQQHNVNHNNSNIINNLSSQNLSNRHHQSNSSLSINSKRSNRSASLVQGGNLYINNCISNQGNKTSLSNVQTMLLNSTLDFIQSTKNNNNSLNITSQRSNELNTIPPFSNTMNLNLNSKTQKISNLLNTSDQFLNNSHIMNNSILNSTKSNSLAQKIKTQTVKNNQVVKHNPKKKTNSLYTNILKNTQKDLNLQIDTTKQLNSTNRVLYTTSNAQQKYVNFERNNIENVNTINFNYQ